MEYKWYILPIGGLYATYHLLREAATTIESISYLSLAWLKLGSLSQGSALTSSKGGVGDEFHQGVFAWLVGFVDSCGFMMIYSFLARSSVENHKEATNGYILLMEEILHHRGCITPCK